MDSLLNVNPGTIIWTIINFSVFLFIILKFGLKPVMNGLKNREEKINTAIENAEKANAEAKKLMKESQEKLDAAQKEMMEIVNKGRHQADVFMQKASEEAERMKQNRIQDAVREIERSKEAAIGELRKEVAGLVVKATEMILEEELNDEKHRKLIDSYIEKLPKN